MNSDESQIKASLKQLYPDAVPSAGLINKVSAMAAEADARALKQVKPTLYLYRRWGLAVAAVSVLAVAVPISLNLLSPKRAIADALRKVSANMDRFQGIHYQYTFFNNGKAAMAQEVWMQNGRLRIDVKGDAAPMTQIIADGKFWNYEPAMNRAWFQKSSGAGKLLINAEQFQAQVRQALSNTHAVSLGSGTREGVRLEKIAVPGDISTTPFSSKLPGRTVLWIDTKRMLPAMIGQQIQVKGQWVMLCLVEYDFDHPIPAKIFTLPKGVTATDWDTFGAQVGKRFAKPLAIQTFGTRTIKLRDVQINKSGDVFVLYTDGSTRDREFEQSGITFEAAGKVTYTGTAGAIEPFMYNQNKEESRGITIGKEVLQGFCMVPVKPLSPSTLPHRFTIGIDVIVEKDKRSLVRQARFVVTPRASVKELLPDYAPDLEKLSLAGGDTKQFRLEREAARRAYYENKGGWAGMIQATDRAIREGNVDPWTFMNRATAFKELGRIPEARQALREAAKQDRLGFYRGEIAKSEKELGEDRPSTTSGQL